LAALALLAAPAESDLLSAGDAVLLCAVAGDAVCCFVERSTSFLSGEPDGERAAVAADDLDAEDAEFE
jgi:hypothetical protein